MTPNSLSLIKEILSVSPSPWVAANSQSFHHLGLLNRMIFPHFTEGFATQLSHTYAHGGGWQPFGADKWQLTLRDPQHFGRLKDITLSYPEDPPMECQAALLHQSLDELFLVFPSAWCAIVQPDGTFDVARLD